MITFIQCTEVGGEPIYIAVQHIQYVAVFKRERQGLPDASTVAMENRVFVVREAPEQIIAAIARARGQA